jgi:hypothetical protein
VQPQEDAANRTDRRAALAVGDVTEGQRGPVRRGSFEPRAAITIELQPETEQALAALAERTNRTEAEIATEAIETYLTGLRQPRPQSFGLGEDPDLHGRTVDDWLKANWRPR